MQYNILINQPKALEWGLNSQQAMLFAFLYHVPSWADPVTVNGRIYYHISKGKVIDDMPLLTDKPDTVYRLMRQLAEKGVIRMASNSFQTLIAITEKGGLWNRSSDADCSEKNPTLGKKSDDGRKKIRPTLGKKSDLPSEKNPTNYIYTNNPVTNDPVTTTQEKSTRGKPRGAKIVTLSASDLVAMGVDQQVADDYMAIRKSSRLPLTKTAMTGLEKQFAIAGLSVPDGIRLCVERGWKGFRAEWIQEKASRASRSDRRKSDLDAWASGDAAEPDDPFLLPDCNVIEGESVRIEP